MPAPAATATASMSSDIVNFTLENLTVTVGTTVTWTNQDGQAHTTTAGMLDNKTGEWDSGFMGQDDTFTHTFAEAGTFAYYCVFHPFMTGTVIVESG